MEIQKGTLIRNKSDGKFAIVVSKPFTKFFPENGRMDYGYADTAVRVKWVECGYERIMRRKTMVHNWEIISD